MKRIIATLAVGLLIGLGTQAYAATFNFSFIAGGNTDTITVTGSDVGLGAYQATSGSLTIGGTTYNLIAPTAISAFLPSSLYVAPGTFRYDDLYWSTAASPVDGYGFLFTANGQYYNLYFGLNGPTLFGYNTTAGTSSVSTGSLSVPDGGMTAAMLGMGMMGLCWVRRFVKK